MNEELKIINQRITKDPEILRRTLDFSIRIVRFYRDLEKDSVGRVIGKQLLRSGTSIGANINEAQGGQSKADFLSKISIAYKECLETSYWLKLIHESDLVSNGEIESLLNESSQLTKIISSIILTSKQNINS